MTAKQRTIYRCSACGRTFPQWRGQCAQCGEWNSLEAETGNKGFQGAAGLDVKRAPVRLDQVDLKGRGEAKSTSMPLLDELLGQGLIPGSAILLGGPPGIGKSTLLLQIAGGAAGRGGRCVYVSGEESLEQLKGRADRLGVLSPGLMAASSVRVEDALDSIDRFESEGGLDLLVVDSVQTLTSSRTEGLPGGVNQVRAVASDLMEKIKQSRTCLILVGHVTKDGQIAGPKLLEHMVDTVLSMEGEKETRRRILRVLKNRFGPSGELLVLDMAKKGLEIVTDPSTLFLGHRDPGLSGSAVVMAVEGRRPFAVEVQALAGKSYLAIPRRTGLGFDLNRLHLLLAVLEKRLKINLGQVDIYAKVGGGLRMQDPGMDLGLVAAVLSSYYDIPLPERSVFWGEVDLNGRIRPAAGQDVRLLQAERLGYSPIIRPGDSGDPLRSGDLVQLQRAFFGKAGRK